MLLLFLNLCLGNDVQETGVGLFERNNVSLEAFKLFCPGFEVRLEGLLTNDSCLLLQLHVRLVEVLALLLQCTKLILNFGEFDR